MVELAVTPASQSEFHRQIGIHRPVMCNVFNATSFDVCDKLRKWSQVNGIAGILSVRSVNISDDM